MIFLAFFLLVTAALAVPRAAKKKSWGSFLIALVLSFFGVTLPLFVFFLSSFMTPDWKGACHFGWLDCFITAKLALTPLVLWATGSLYALEILRAEQRTERGLVIGIFFGAVIATICFVFGVACFGNEIGARIWLIVPFYVAVWYSLRAIQLMLLADFGFWTYFASVAASLPLWLISGLWSRSLFASLPDKAPDCFIVTAASRGHKNCVGPLVEIARHGHKRHANQQLLTFWQLENQWQQHSPRSHRIFRRCYNRFGPLIARQIKSPWQADLVHLAIKPVELAARLALQINAKNLANKNEI